MQWYYSKNGTQLGPVEEGELRAKLASGEISSADLVWREGMTDWLPSAKVAELAGSAAAAPSAYAPSAPSAPPSFGDTGSSPYTPPVAFPQGAGVHIPNYLWQSIVVTIFCCWAFGIPAIVYAAKVDGLKARGDIAGAQAASKSAKTWCMVSAGTMLVLFALWLLLVGFSAAFSQH